MLLDPTIEVLDIHFVRNKKQAKHNLPYSFGSSSIRLFHRVLITVMELILSVVKKLLDFGMNFLYSKSKMIHHHLKSEASLDKASKKLPAPSRTVLQLRCDFASFTRDLYRRTLCSSTIEDH